jgi:hypothetical protein
VKKRREENIEKRGKERRVRDWETERIVKERKEYREKRKRAQ